MSNSGKLSGVADGDVGTAKLVAWLEDMGGFVDGVRVVDAGAAGRRLVADRELPAGFVLARIPVNCSLSSDTCAAMSHGLLMQEHFQLIEPEELEEGALEQAPMGAFTGAVPRPVVTRRSALYAALMVAPIEEGSPFGPHISELRGCPASTPFTWGKDGGIESLEDAWEDVPRAVKEEWCDYWDTLHIEYSTLFPALCEACPDQFPQELCTETAWIRAHSLYTSRAFPYRPEAQSPDGVLLPLLDRLNHDSVKCNVEWCGVGLEEARGARTTQAVAAGEELFYSYGCKGNVELVLGYGFAVWGNPHEVARVRIDLEDFLSADDGEFDRAEELFEAALNRICGDANFCDRRDPGKATFKLASEDLCPDVSSGPWKALCKLCSDVYVSFKRVSPEDLLRDILTKVCIGLLGKMAGGTDWEPEAWDAHVAAVKAHDTVEVSDFLIAQLLSQA